MPSPAPPPRSDPPSPSSASGAHAERAEEPAKTNQLPRRRPRAYRSPLAWAVLLVTLASAIALDLATKHWSFENVAHVPVDLDRQQILANPSFNPVPPHEGIHALPWELLDLRLVVNRGAVFGIGQNRRFMFIAFTVFALGAGLVVFARWTTDRQRLAHIAIALILAGGIGNLYDRYAFGVVRDFLHLMPGWDLPFGWSWPGGSREVFPWVFNVADVLLLTGMGLLMIHINRHEKRRRKKESERKEADVEAVSA